MCYLSLVSNSGRSDYKAIQLHVSAVVLRLALTSYESQKFPVTTGKIFNVVCSSIDVNVC